MRPLLSLSLVYTYVARARVSTVREYPSFCSTGGLFDSNFRRNSCKLGEQYSEGRFERSSIEGNRPVEIFPALPGLMTSSSFRYFSNLKNNVRSSTFESNGEISRNGGGVTGIGGGRDYGQLENLWFGHIDFGAKTGRIFDDGFRGQRLFAAKQFSTRALSISKLVACNERIR